MRSFADLTDKDLHRIYTHCVSEIMQMCDQMDIKLCEPARGNIFTVLITALFNEWEKAKEAKNICLTMGSE